MKFFKIISISVLIATSVLSTCYAYETKCTDTESEQEIVIRSDVLEWRYKTIAGVLYKRRWNVTQNCWYDSSWIPA